MNDERKPPYWIACQASAAWTTLRARSASARSGAGGQEAFAGEAAERVRRCRVLEIVEDHQHDTYRAVYTVKYAAAVYVLHVFQKKAKKGSATPKADVDLIKKRLEEAERDAKEHKR